MTGNLFIYEILGRVRVSAHVPPTGIFPNYLVSRLTVCLRDERRVAWYFRAHAHLTKEHAFRLRIGHVLKTIIYVIFFFKSSNE